MSMLGRFKKVAFLLLFDPTNWVASCVYNRKPQRRFSARGHPGLLDLSAEPKSPDTVFQDAASISRTMSSTWSGISRSASNVSQSIVPSRSSSLDDDVDRRADEFIANFRLHLLRENSLNLPYCHRQDSLEISSPIRVD